MNKYILPLTLFLLSACTTVDEGERAVKLRWGKSVDVVDPGFHWEGPGVDYKKISIRRETFSATALAITTDTQRVDVELTVNYQVDPALIGLVYSTVGSDPNRWDSEIEPKAQDAAKTAVAKYTIEQLTANRDDVREEIAAELEAVMPKGFLVNSVQLTGMTFSNAYNVAIEQKQIAEQDALKAKNELEKNSLDVQKQTQLAQAEADSAIARAKGEAQALEIRGEAWSKYMKTLGESGANLQLRFLELENRKAEIETWNGATPRVVAGNSSILLPEGSKE